MKKYVITHNVVEGFHHYPKPPYDVGFLKHEHRHRFVIRCKFGVTDSNREIEIFIQENEIALEIERYYGNPAKFGAMSCEMIAEWLLDKFPKCEEVEVLEDGYGGAVIQR